MVTGQKLHLQAAGQGFAKIIVKLFGACRGDNQ
jgi:hypothetical protein